jgi:hypothetical protein
MPQITIISDQVRTVDGTTADGQVLLSPDALAQATGWVLKPEGLCRDDVCVPVRDRAALTVGDRLDFAAVAAALGRPSVVDGDAGLAAMALDAESRREALDTLHAPPFTLDDLDGRPHSLAEWAGRRKLLLAFSSW